MISPDTQQQLEELRISAHRPLLICDVDDVVVHFIRAFEDYIAAHRLFLDPASFALNGNVRHRDSGEPMENAKLARLIDEFFHDSTETLKPIDGALDALNEISRTADVVLLTNLPHHARAKRVANMRGLGLDFPVVTNSGPKGPAIREMARRSAREVVFIDDSPNFIASSFEHAPHVHLVHFLHDTRFARHVQPFDFVSLTASHWRDAGPHIASLLG